MIIGLHTIGVDIPIGAIDPDNAGISGTATLFFASEPFTSLPTDANPNRHYAQAVQAITLRDTAIRGNVIGGAMSITRGRLTMANPDGSLDPAFFFGSVDGRSIVIKALARNNPPGGESLDDAFVLFDGVMETPELDSKRVVVPLRCGGALLDAPVQSENFAGTGGVEGGDDLLDKPKPVALGYSYGVTPVYLGVISGKHSYSVAGGVSLPINDVPAFYDRGVGLSKVAGTPTAGEYAIDTATGVVTIGGTVPQVPTCDIEGYVQDGTFLTTTADIWNAIIVDFLELSNTMVDSASVSQMNTDQPADVGIWVGAEDVTAEAVINELLVAASTIGGCSRSGRFVIQLLKSPSNVIRAVYDEQNIIEITRIIGPDNMNPAHWKYMVGWQRNYTPTDDVATGASEAQRSFMRTEYREAIDSDTDIQTSHRRSTPTFVPGLFANQADAETEAARLLALFDAAALYRIDAGDLSPELDIGHVVEITYARFNLNKRLGTIVAWTMDVATRRFNPVVFVE